VGVVVVEAEVVGIVEGEEILLVSVGVDEELATRALWS
jgi:hypothetical protein